MSKIAFIGLGIMGLPMAGNLIDAGHEVTGYNHAVERTEQLAERGARIADSSAAAAEQAEVICLMVPDSPDVEQVLTGEGGVFGAARPGSLIIDFSSIRPDVSAALAARAAEHDLTMIDAPVSGGEAGAIDGTLSIMVGGSPEAFARAEPVLNAVGSTIVHVGPNGAGQTVKAANQLMVAGHLQVLAEALAFLEAYGADTTAALRVLGGGLAGSKVLALKGEAMRERSFAPGFRIDLHHKDLGIVTTAARGADVILPLGSQLAALMASARAAGDGELDHSALFRGVLRANGRPLE
ncbi:NAD(P)-dependent oxidoreductase [Naumannella cuiyingiana]|uniref:2-hydroxy-3-oxopropionate reductase n=1 Tax=Naumannella cuiyingiana TaxID=1347891 RepID=A0A7Z0D830_9ACTN|nr:NAD(P)-dependent oxidoreductase [Naumannella cuiyingiana]NYI70661.1 2-hydroxy-3-oxopropionate reductase [Naumannella cuiyingiana]